MPARTIADLDGEQFVPPFRGGRAGIGVADTVGERPDEQRLQPIRQKADRRSQRMGV